MNKMKVSRTAGSERRLDARFKSGAKANLALIAFGQLNKSHNDTERFMTRLFRLRATTAATFM